MIYDDETWYRILHEIGWDSDLDGVPADDVVRHVRELLDLVQGVRDTGRDLATLVQEDIDACGNRPPHPDDCPYCHPQDDALLAWGIANWRLHRMLPARLVRGELPDVATCRVCGCTESWACDGGCWWVPDPEGGDLCSSCARRLYGTDDPSILEAIDVDTPDGDRAIQILAEWVDAEERRSAAFEAQNEDALETQQDRIDRVLSLARILVQAR